jgi:hypothetical protein
MTLRINDFHVSGSSDTTNERWLRVQENAFNSVEGTDDRLGELNSAYVASGEDKCAHTCRDQRHPFDLAVANVFITSKCHPAFGTSVSQPLDIRAVVSESLLVTDDIESLLAQSGR